MVFEYTTDGGTTWTTKDISIVNLFNEATMTLSPALNADGTGFRAYDVNTAADEEGVISGKKYIANYWTNKGVRITIDCYDEGRAGTVDLLAVRYGTSGSTSNKSHYKIER